MGKRTWLIPVLGFLVILLQPKNGETLTKSVRHGRHRRVSGPDPVVPNSNGIVSKEEQKENKYKPNFERCDDYKPEVLEEEPVGTRVIRVFASDADESGPNGEVTYSIVSTHDKFSIDAKNGWLVTNAVFNRDEPDREKLVHVCTLAIDIS